MAPDGTLWMATWGGGISRFDGSKWETFNAEKTLSDFMIRCLAFDRDGALWVGTPEGIRRYDGRNWSTYTTDNTPGLKEDSVFVILPFNTGEIWFGMLDGYLYSYDQRRADGQRWKLVQNPEFFATGAIRSLLELDDGTIWVGGEHLYHFDGTRWTGYPMNQVAFSICRTDDGHIYAAETNGLYRLDGTTWKRIPEAGESPRSLGLTSDRSLLVGTEAGVKIFAHGNWADFLPDLKESAQYVEVIRTFPNGSTWLGTRGGAYLVRRSDWSIYPPPGRDSPVTDGLFHSAPDCAPTVISPKGAIYQLEGDSWRLVGDIQSGNDPVVQILLYEKDRLVVRRDHNIVEYDTNGFKIRQEISVPSAEEWSMLSLSGTREWDRIALSSDGTYWWNRNREEQLYHWNGSSWELYRQGDGVHLPISFFKETRDGRFWIVSNSQVSASGHHIPELDALRSPRYRGHQVTDISVSDNDSAWFSTSGEGILVYDGQQLVHWDARNGLPSNWVLCLFRASDGTMWSGMEDSTMASFKDGRWVSFSTADFQAKGGVTRISEGPGGRIWFVLSTGNLLRYTLSKEAPDTAIDLYPRSILPRGSAVFAFHGWDSSLTTLPADLVFSWRILPRWGGRATVPWTPYAPATTISSPPLDPGNYLFQVKAADKERNEDPTPAGQAFSVETYLYFKPEFWLTVIPTILLMLFLAVRWTEARRNLLKLARIDGLTEFYNRDYFASLFDSEIQRTKRYQHDLSILLLDIDDFKHVNDGFGHDIGDQVLRTVSRKIAQACRATDSVARWGGEEFLILLPETSLQKAAILAERIRAAVEATTVSTDQGNVQCTVSVGAAEFTEEASTSDQLLKQADQALYRAKRAGRNRIEFFSLAPGDP